MENKNEIPVMRQGIARKFTCWADKCYCNCCQNWEISVDGESYERYKKYSPDVLEHINVKKEEGKDDSYTMKRIPCETGDKCPFLDDKGMCGLRKKHGNDFTTLLCYYFPNTHKKIGDKIYMPLSLPCPASIELALYSNDLSDFDWYPDTRVRVETKLYDIKETFPGANLDKLMNMFDAVMFLVNGEPATPGEIIGKLLLFANDYDKIPYDKKLNLYLRSIGAATKQSVKTIASLKQYDYDDILIKLASFSIYRQDNWIYKNAIASMIKNVFPDKKEQLDYFDMKELKAIEEKIKDASSDEKKQLEAEREELIKKMGEDNSELICENKNSKSFSELKSIWDRRKHEFDNLFRNYIRASLCQIIYPLAITHFETKRDIYIIALHFALMRFVLICAIDKIGDVEKDKDKIVKIFFGVEKGLYTYETKWEVDSFNGVIDVYNIHYLIDLCRNFL